MRDATTVQHGERVTIMSPAHEQHGTFAGINGRYFLVDTFWFTAQVDSESDVFVVVDVNGNALGFVEDDVLPVGDPPELE